jgi:CHAT domain-containing protein
MLFQMEATSDPEELQNLIQLVQEAYEACDAGPEKNEYRQTLYTVLLSQFGQTGDSNILESAYPYMQEGDPEFVMVLQDMISLADAKFQMTGSFEELKKSMDRRLRWLNLKDVKDPDQQGLYLIQLNVLLSDLRNDSLSLEDLGCGIKWCKEAMEIPNLRDDIRTDAIRQLSILLTSRFEAKSDVQDLTDAISAAEMVLDSMSEENPVHRQVMLRLVNLLSRHAQFVTGAESREDIRKALSWAELLEAMCPHEDPIYVQHLNNLGSVHNLCFVYGVEDADDHLQESLKVLERAESRSILSQYRPAVLHTLAITLGSLYETTGSRHYLERGVSILRQCIELGDDTLVELADVKVTLGTSLQFLYRETNDEKELEESIQILSGVLGLSNNTPIRQQRILRQLCSAYHNLYARRHQPQQIQMAIKYGRDGLQCHVGSQKKALLLHSLSNAYNAKYEFESELGDLDESIELLRLAVVDTADTLAPRYLTALADRLRLRSGVQRNAKDLNDAILQCQTALDLPQISDSDYRFALGTMSGIYYQLFELERDSDALEKAEEKAQEALPLYPPTNENKANLLDLLSRISYFKFHLSQKKDDILRSVQFTQDALDVIPKTSLRYPTILYHSGLTFSAHMKFFKTSEYQYQVKANLLEQLASPVSRPVAKVRARRLLASMSIEEKDWNTAFMHLSAAIELYPKISSRAFNSEDQQKTMQELAGVAQTAASCGLNAGQDPEKVLELLEAGRGIISGWIINGRNDISRLEGKDPVLAERYVHLRDILSVDVTQSQSMVYNNGTELSSLREQDQWRNYLYELEEIEQEVRSKYAGMESFQRALSGKEMKELATNIPIVEINATELRSDAFIITDSGVVSISLVDKTHQKMLDIASILFGPDRQKRSLPLERSKTNDALRQNLKWLYENVVSKIMGELKISPDASSVSKRLTWVSNGTASFCPLHAADTFSGNQNECTSSHVVSSYIPSLKALQFSREKPFNVELNSTAKVLVIAMPETKGQQTLSAKEEAANISSTFSHLPPDTVNVLTNCSREQALESLKDCCSLAHFACHGQANDTDPSKSCLLLADTLRPGEPDKLTAQDLSLARHDLAQLCYLSACSTAENIADGLADENIHVASAFQLSGFSHVVGTLWEAGDRVAVEVAKVFYHELVDSISKRDRKGQGHDVIAYALHKAVKTVKETKRPGSRLNPKMDVLAWAPFVHLGP